VIVYHFPDAWLGPATHGTYVRMVYDLLDSPVIHTGEWQAMDTTGSKLHGTHELEDVSLVWDQLPDDLDTIVPHIDHSWADDHFAERVSGIPHNPAPSAPSWPYAVRNNGDHTHAGVFDHTYPERFWPRHAGNECPSPEECMGLCDGYHGANRGIRFPYGDLNDVAALLARSPLTRQAFLPVWFPEDTGAVKGQRVPCTLGYHFMQRHGKLSCRYYIRSCDAYRHLSNDVYLSARLTQWMCKRVRDISNGDIRFHVGSMTMHISSLHAFVADVPKIKVRMQEIPA
jgi:hypothetical protein